MEGPGYFMKETNRYIEIHDTQTFDKREYPHHASPMGKILPLFVSLALLGMVVLLLRKSIKSTKKIQDDALVTAAANTKAIEENNQLLKESIQIQQETNALLTQWIAKESQDGDGQN